MVRGVRMVVAGRALAVAVVLATLAVPAQAQTDQIDVSGARVYGSPGDLMRWPITAKIESVTFTDFGFPVYHDRMEGPNAWGDQTTPGWDGPLQYTLGMCLKSKADNQWECSAAIQFWRGRQAKDPVSTSGPYQVAENWFYDQRWGPLAYRGPLPGESVGIFVCRGDCRGNTPPTRERSNVALVKWDTDYVAPAVSSGPVPAPPAAPVPTSQAPAASPSSSPVAPPAASLAGVAGSDQVERIFADLVARDERSVRLLEALQAQLRQHDEHPSWVVQALKNRYVQMGLAGVGALVGQAAVR